MDRRYSIRLALPSDVAALPAIELAAARRFLTTTVRGAFLDESTPLATLVEAEARGNLFVAVHRGECVGFAQTGVLRDGDAWLAELDVHPDHGRRGLGRALVEQAVRWAGQRGASAIGLSTFRDVAWNAPFYARVGFRVLSPAEWSHAHRAVVMEERQRGLPTELRVIMQRRLDG